MDLLRLARRVAVTACVALSPICWPALGQAQTPRSIAALGDSLTVALRACAPTVACPESSWSTGSSPLVNSHFLRLGQLAAPVTRHNFAVSGRKVADLNPPIPGAPPPINSNQAQKAVTAGVEYVTILIGTNDVCRESIPVMTTASAFRAQFVQAMNTLTTGLPGARIFVASIPDPERLRELFGASAAARAVWAADDPPHGTCAVFLQDADSNHPTHVARRGQAQARLAELNFELAGVCALYARCVFDDHAVFNWDFGAEHITTADYFHFSEQGQAALAALTYPLAFQAALPAPPPPPVVVSPPPPALDPAPPARVVRFPAKLKVKRAAIRDGQLDALLGISGRATGTLRIEHHSAATKQVFRVALGPAREGEKHVKVLRALTGAQRRARTGILTVSYDGNASVFGDLLRSRAASQRSLLKRTALSLDGTRLRVAGTIAPAVSGVVRLRVTYTGASGAVEQWSYDARIAGGRWRADRRLPAAAGADVNAYLTMQFTGHLFARGGPHRGEQDGKGLGSLPAG